MVWNAEGSTDKSIALTFDDGPIPEITPWVLKILEERAVKATFFVVGQNAEKYPELLKELVSNGHRIGNHTQNHLNGWKTSDAAYIKSILQCQSVIDRYYDGEKLFRPPYGKIKPSQIKRIAKSHKIVMWDYLIGDFDMSQNSEELYSRAVDGVKNNSIVIFHDSIKAEKHLRALLPRFLDHFLEQEYTFKTL